MTSLEFKIRMLVAEHSLKDIDICFNKYKKELYDYLKPIVIKEEIVKPIVKSVIIDLITDVKEVIKPVIVDLSEENKNVLVKHEEDPSIKNIIVTGVQQPNKLYNDLTKEEAKLKNKEDKAKHSELVSAKRNELKSKGIKPEDLLTKESLTKWLVHDKMTYMQIALETGCSEPDISAISKTFGLESDKAKFIKIQKILKSNNSKK